MKITRCAMRDRRACRAMFARTWLAALALVSAPQLLHADLLRETFDAGIPATWSIEDYRLVQHAVSSDISWGMTSPATYANYTGGAGDAAMADSDSSGDGVEYDVALLTPMMHLPSESGLSLSFLSNYQNNAGADFASVDIRRGSGGEWTSLLSWNEDHGDSFRRPIGESVTLSLDDYAGQDVQIRFHYFDPGENDWNWYWQVDNVAVTPAPGAGAVGLIAGAALLRRRRR